MLLSATAVLQPAGPSSPMSINCGTHDETNRDQCITVLVWLVWLYSRSSENRLEEDSRSSNNHLWGSYVTAEHKPGEQHQVNIGSKPMKQLIQSLCRASKVTVTAPWRTHKNSIPSSSSDETCCSRWSKAAATSQNLRVQTSLDQPRKAPPWPATTALLPYAATLTHHGDLLSSHYSLMTCVWINEHEQEHNRDLQQKKLYCGQSSGPPGLHSTFRGLRATPALM